MLLLKRIRDFLIWASIVLILTMQDILASSLIINPQHLLRKRDRRSEFSVYGNFDQYRGNTNIVKISAGILGRVISGNNLYLAISDTMYGEDNGLRNIRHTMAHLRYLREIGEFFSIEAYAQNQYDEFRRIDIRALGGIGPRIAFEFKGIFELAMGTSYLYEYDRNNEASDSLGNLYPDSGEISKYNRWSNYIHLDFHVFKNTYLVSTLYWQPRFDQFKDYRLFSHTMLKVNIRPIVNLFFSGTVVYDSRPSFNVHPKDTIFRSGFEFILKSAPDAKQGENKPAEKKKEENPK